MDLDLYNRQILRLAASLPRVGRLADPDASATAHSRLCGSRITIDLKLNEDVVTDYAQEVRACAIGQAVASLVARDEVDQGARILRAVLQDKTVPPPGPWAGLEPFLPVADVRSRHASALLPFEALQHAIAEVSPERAGRRPAAVSAAVQAPSAVSIP